MILDENTVKQLAFLDEEWEEVTELFVKIKNDLAFQILRTLPNDKEKREELFYTAKAMDAFEIKLQEYINDAKLTQGNN